MTDKAIVILPDDTVEVREFQREHSYAFLNTTVGGWIEAVGLAEGITGWCNEEGKLMDPPLPPNRMASIIARLNGGIELPGDYIAGPFVICGVNEDGETTGLDDELIGLILAAAEA